MHFKTVKFLDINITLIGVADLIEYMANEALAKRTRLINNVNVHAYALSFKDRRFREVLNQSDIVFCDGFGVKLGAKFMGLRLEERMTPPDWIDRFFDRCAKEGIGVFFLGDEPSVLPLFLQKVKSKHPGLNICGAHHGFFTKSGTEQDTVINAVNQSGAQVLITGMGMPLQEFWAFDNKERLPGKVILGTGALFKWYSGAGKRGPKVFTDNGFEWLWRLFVQPRRVWKRYVLEVPQFFYVVLQQRLRNKPRQPLS